MVVAYLPLKGKHLNFSFMLLQEISLEMKLGKSSVGEEGRKLFKSRINPLGLKNFFCSSLMNITTCTFSQSRERE